MNVAIASDHAGFVLKKEIKTFLAQEGYQCEDFGTYSQESIDYPDIAVPLAEQIVSTSYTYGILICGTGIGVSITANKIPGIRAAICHDIFSAKAAREHNNANILTLGARVIGPGLAIEVVKIFLTTKFAGGRHQRRVDKIHAVEKKYCRPPQGK